MFYEQFTGKWKSFSLKNNYSIPWHRILSQPVALSNYRASFVHCESQVHVRKVHLENQSLEKTPQIARQEHRPESESAKTEVVNLYTLRGKDSCGVCSPQGYN